MKFIKILLILVFAATAALYTLHSMDRQADHTAEGPTLTREAGTLNISVHSGDEALLDGITATDAQDGDLTDRIIISGVSKLTGDDTFKATYVVFDSDDNMATVTRQVHYTDYRRPRFILDEPLAYTTTQNLALLDRLHATDVVDGSITHSVRVSYARETDVPEIYYIDVQVTNSMGDTSWLTVPILIQEEDKDRPMIALDTYLVYLQTGEIFDPYDHLLGATWNGDTLLAQNLTVSGRANTNVPGTYYITYTASYAGHTGTAILTVVVE